jgi:hypothetical protein
MTYNSHKLNEELGTAFRNFYPSFRALRMIVSSYPGGGKSTLLASVPVLDGYTREVFDHEDSEAFLDAGVDGEDMYTPRRQQFRMHRITYPTLNDYADLYERIKKGEKIGALCIDNIAIFQDELKAAVMRLSANPATLRALYKRFDADSQLPVDGMTKNWARYQDGVFWASLKLIPRQLITICNKQGVHFIGATEEGNVWEGYGTKDAKITGKKAKIWDAWYRYTDVVLSLSREVNTTKPPKAQLYPGMPKNRLQGMNPSWSMDWQGFVAEIDAANKRTGGDIPAEAMVKEIAVVGDDDIKEAITEQVVEIVEMEFPALLTWAKDNHQMDEAQVRLALKEAKFTSYNPGMALAAQAAIEMAPKKVEPKVEMVPGTEIPMSEMTKPEYTWPNLLKYAKKTHKIDEQAVKDALKEAGFKTYSPQTHIAARSVLDQKYRKIKPEVEPDFMKEPAA